MSLRARLVAGILALLVVLGVAIGGISTAVLRGQLVARLDAELVQSVQRSEEVLVQLQLAEQFPRTPMPDVDRFVLGEGAGAIGAIVSGGAFYVAGYIDENGVPRTLDPQQRRELVSASADGRPHTVQLGRLGSYRVVISAIDSDTGVVVGLPLAEVDATVNQLLLTIGLVTAVTVAVASVLGTLVVRLALRPLDRVVATATSVSELDLDEGDVELVQRVPDVDAVPSEIGRVGSALNRLLEKVGSALAARQASETKLRRFVADASHELRTPLASIRGYAEFVRTHAPELDEDLARGLERIDSESQRMTALVQDMLLLARLDADPSLEREPVGLARLVADAVSDAQIAGPDHDWRLDLPDAEVEVAGDPARLHQVVANLLANARIHTPAGTTVTASVSRMRGEPGARVRIADDGPGIPAELMPHLFERFVRGDQSRSRSASGGSTGLGLAIVRAIVDAHGGTVSVESEPGRTVFTVDLPHVPAAPPPLAPNPAPSAQNPAPSAQNPAPLAPNPAETRESAVLGTENGR